MYLGVKPNFLVLKDITRNGWNVSKIRQNSGYKASEQDKKKSKIIDKRT